MSWLPAWSMIRKGTPTPKAHSFARWSIDWQSGTIMAPLGTNLSLDAYMPRRGSISTSGDRLA